MRYAVILWETQKLFNVPSFISSSIFSITKKFIVSACNFSKHQCELFFIEQLNEIKNIKDFDKYIIISNGVMIFNPIQFWNGIENQHSKVCGHLLNLKNTISIHEQFLMFDREIFNLLESIDLDICIEYENHNFASIERSPENVHDDYTPLWIKWNGKTEHYEKPFLEGIRGTYENIIDVILKAGYTIDNVNSDIRKSKFYTYHVYKPDDFFKNITKKELNDDMYAGHKSFYEIFDNSKYIWMYNTEPVFEFNGTYDCFIGVGSGPIPWISLIKNNFEPGSNIYLFDINENTTRFNEWFLNQSSEVYNMDWDKIFEISPFKDLFTIGDKDGSIKIWNENKELFIKDIEKIKSFKYHFIKDDIISSELVENAILESKKSIVWFSNVFSYFETFENNYQDFHLEYFLYRILKSNKNTQWVGAVPSTGRTVTSSESKSNTLTDKSFYEEIIVDDFDIEEFLKEIKSLEDHNLFVKHRAEYHTGWESFTLHGTAYNNTETSKEELDHWTDEALEHCPTIVKYIQNSNLKEKYSRVRIMKLNPNSYINIHSDDMFSKTELWGLNLAINNPDECLMHFWDESFNYLGTVPWQPKKCFKIKISNKHMVINNSDKNRYHIIIHGRGGRCNDTY